MRSTRSLSAPSALTRRPASMDSSRIVSWSSWRLPPALTAAISTFSVAMKGSSAAACFRITCGQTWMPSMTLRASCRATSVARNASGRTTRRFAESSSERSSHWLAAVCAALSASEMTSRESEVIRSHRMGLRLYAIADDPTCLRSKGSSISFLDARSRMSTAILVSDCASPERRESTRKSILREYVWPETGMTVSNPLRRATRRSSARAFWWSPPKSSTYEACVPVVPLTPRNGSAD
eukprot:Amastigsp_a340965_83.p2 type:complete len:238 gc:universal Amastigsp_a340965_83:312-1025(+)